MDNMQCPVFNNSQESHADGGSGKALSASSFWSSECFSLLLFLNRTFVVNSCAKVSLTNMRDKVFTQEL